MSKELVISANRHETRVALIEDDQLVEVYFQRANEYSLAGSIHKGRVTRVLPGMQSAFVDLGLERDTFLYVSDFLEEHEDFDRVTGDERPARGERPERERERRPPPPSAPPVQPAAAAPEPAALTAAPEPASAPAGERPPDRNDERRGRRSRRRRNRGRGFPDSKYASESEPAPVEAAPAAEIASPAPVPSGESLPLVLPGESLAKYRGTVAPLPETRTPPPLEIEEEFDEPIHYPPENAMPDAPAHEGALAEPASEIAEPAADAAPPPASEPAASETGPAVAPMLDEEEDHDIQAMILGHGDALDEVTEGIDPGDEIEEAGEDGPEARDSMEGVADIASPADPESGTAAVRERGGRYPHRVSRRTRRRGGRGSQDNRPPEGRVHESRAETRPEGYRAPAAAADRSAERTVARPALNQPSISDLLKEGQEIIVQIAKEPLGQKGARITSHIALPGRYVVYMPTLEHMGVSRKISSDEERLRLKRILQSRRPGPVGGFITRTAAEGRTDEEIAGDMAFLYNLWQDIRHKSEKRPAPMLLHHDLDIVQRILRDQLADSFKAIWIDNEDAYESVLRFVERFQPALVPKVKLYTRDAPIFDAFNVSAELEKALRPKVWLKSGGYIVINQTEALVAIDVNTGKYVGKSNRLEDTIVKTNTEAIKEIVRQIRLRDLGGIIVIDFIDMDERKNRQKVMQVLEEAMRVDRAPYKILQFNDFGLVAITRKRVKQSLERTLCSPCPHCDGAGYIKSVQTVVTEILAEARKVAASVEGKDVMLRVHPDVAKLLKSQQNKYLEELEEVLRRPVLVKSDPLLHHEKFDLA